VEERIFRFGDHCQTGRSKTGGFAVPEISSKMSGGIYSYQTGAKLVQEWNASV
jgi:hypothetical protein